MAWPKTENIQKNSEAWILIKVQCVIHQWIRFDKLYKPLESFFQISKSFLQLVTILLDNSGVGFMYATWDRHLCWSARILVVCSSNGAHIEYSVISRSVPFLYYCHSDKYFFFPSIAVGELFRNSTLRFIYVSHLCIVSSYAILHLFTSPLFLCIRSIRYFLGTSNASLHEASVTILGYFCFLQGCSYAYSLTEC